MGAYQGVVRGNVAIRRFREIHQVTKGFPKANAMSVFESQKLPIRGEGALFTIEMEEMGKEVNGGPLGKLWAVKGENLRIWQTSLPELLNYYKWSKDQVQMFLKSGNGEWWNFVAPTGNFATPAGSCLLNQGFKFKCNKKERFIELMHSGQLTDAQYDYIDTNKAAAATGGSGGTAHTITAMTVDKSKILRPGFHSLTSNAVNVGKLIDVDFEMSSIAQSNQLDQGEAVHDKIGLKLSATASQIKVADGEGSITDALSRYAQVLTSKEDETWTFGAGVLNLKNAISFGDGDGTMKLEYYGEVLYNTDEATPDTINIGVGSATAVTFTAAGY